MFDPESSLPHQISAIIGHDAAKRQIEQAYDGGRMHHAWLLLGAEGIGKATLAYGAARLLLSGGACRFDRPAFNDPSARLIAAQAHPDMFVLSCPDDEKTGGKKDSIPVESARSLAHFMGLTASQGGGRFALIDEAHKMTRSAQNAILKTIEEPPAGAVIFLTATTVGGLLPTIRSRCRLLPMRPLADNQVEAVLARLGLSLPDGEGARRLLRMAGGSAGQAVRLIEADALSLLDEMAAILARIPAIDYERLHLLAERVAGKGGESDTFAVVGAYFLDALRKTARAVALGEVDALGLGAKFSGRLDKILEVCESAASAFAMAKDAHLDRKLAMINALCAIRRMAA